MAHVCPWWFAYTFDNPLRKFFHKPEKMFSQYLEEGMTAIDIGCGMGFFSIGMAKIVGETGTVISVDLQQKMLDVLMRRAQRAGVSDQIRVHACRENEIGTHEKVDFALLFWMVHEVPDRQLLFNQVCSILKPDGKLLIAEPGRHVSIPEFEVIIESAGHAGLRLIDHPPIRLSHGALLKN